MRAVLSDSTSFVSVVVDLLLCILWFTSILLELFAGLVFDIVILLVSANLLRRFSYPWVLLNKLVSWTRCWTWLLLMCLLLYRRRFRVSSCTRSGCATLSFFVACLMASVISVLRY